MLEQLVVDALRSKPDLVVGRAPACEDLAAAFAASRARVVVCAHPDADVQYASLLASHRLPAVLELAEHGRSARLFGAVAGVETFDDISGEVLRDALQSLISHS